MSLMAWTTGEVDRDAMLLPSHHWLLLRGEVDRDAKPILSHHDRDAMLIPTHHWLPLMAWITREVDRDRDAMPTMKLRVMPVQHEEIRQYTPQCRQVPSGAPSAFDFHARGQNNQLG
jgi:hypothetical protein